MSDDLTPSTRLLISAIERGEVASRTGYLVGLDRPALLAPDPAALMAARRPQDILTTGHRWRVVTRDLWIDLLDLGRERPEQVVLVIQVQDLEAWLPDGASLSELDANGWRGSQGTVLVLPVTWTEPG